VLTMPKMFNDVGLGLHCCPCEIVISGPRRSEIRDFGLRS
jgi:hypothetical protein